MLRLMLSAALILVCFVRPALGQSGEPRPFWSEIQVFVQQDRANGVRPCRTLFVGSSSIRFWLSLERDLPDRQVIRRGFGGGHLTHVVRYFDLLIKPHRPKQIVLYAGENDVAGGRSPSDVLAALSSFLDLKSKSLGSTPVYFIAIKPSLYHWDKFDRQSRANKLIQRLAETRSDLVFVNVVPLMLKKGRPKKIFVADGLHMNRDGYALWTKAVRKALDQPNGAVAPHCSK